MTDLEQTLEQRDAKREPSPEPRMILALGLAGLLSGLAIVLVYEFTLPMIEANRAAAIRRSVFKVVPGSTSLQKLVPTAEGLVVSGDDDAAEAIYAAYDDKGAFVGYAIPGEGAGFQDTIRLIYGFRPKDKHVIGMDVLESKETPGLGDKIYKDAAFVGNFADLATEPDIVVVKNGTRQAKHEVDGITGATISSKAIVKIINASNAKWLVRLPQPGQEPKLEITKEGDK